MKNKLLITFVLTILAENAGITAPASAHSVIVKFSYAMIGVVISTIAIFLGLTVYNKIRKHSKNLNLETEEILKTPKTKEDAIKFYIRRNKI